MIVEWVTVTEADDVVDDDISDIDRYHDVIRKELAWWSDPWLDDDYEVSIMTGHDCIYNIVVHDGRVGIDDDDDTFEKL